MSTQAAIESKEKSLAELMTKILQPSFGPLRDSIEKASEDVLQIKEDLSETQTNISSCLDDGFNLLRKELKRNISSQTENFETHVNSQFSQQKADLLLSLEKSLQSIRQFGENIEKSIDVQLGQQKQELLSFLAQELQTIHNICETIEKSGLDLGNKFDSEMQRISVQSREETTQTNKAILMQKNEMKAALESIERSHHSIIEALHNQHAESVNQISIVQKRSRLSLIFSCMTFLLAVIYISYEIWMRLN